MASGDKHEKPCPNCGHCPTCGRSNYRPIYPFYPYLWGGWRPLPPYYTNPVWTNAGSPNQSQMSSGYFSNTASAN